MEWGDRALIARLRAATEGTRAFLCALARRGKHLATTEPERARALLDAVHVHPLYKGARLGFDLLELEDLMLDGPAPTQVAGYFEAEAVRGVAQALMSLRDTLVQLPAAVAPGVTDRWSDVRELAPLAGRFTLAEEEAPAGGWPELNSSDYLYDLFVLGLLRQASAALAAEHAAAEATSGDAYA